MRRSIPLLLLGLLISSCASSSDEAQRAAELEKRYVVTYYDRNHDGIVDLEVHRLPGGADSDYALCDTKFTGRYDLRIDWSYTIEKERVDLPVSKGVKITHEKVPRFILRDISHKTI